MPSKSLLSSKLMKINPEDINPAVESEGDKAHRMARAIIGALPAFSGTALETFNALIEPPMEKRKREWMVKVSEAINELYDKHSIEIDQLSNNEQFVSILIQASNTALKNHQEEKLEALKTVLINSAIHTDLSEDVQASFLALIQDFTCTHLEILKHLATGFCWSPARATGSHNTLLELSRVLLRELPHLSEQADFVYQIITDLEAKKLLMTYTAQNIRKLENGEITVMGSSAWGQLLSLKPGNINHLNPDSPHKYVTQPTSHGINFLNYIYSTDEE